MLAAVLRAHRREMLKQQRPGIAAGWVFVNRKGNLYNTATLRKPLERVMERVGIDRRQTTHGFRRTFNNLVRQFATGEVVRAMTGHVTEAMTLHYSHVDIEEKKAALALVLGTLHPEVEDQVEGGDPETRTAGEESSSTGRNR
ncbi:MAG: tyrosine-type recombinase/integrase [Myxococcales bacterium]|nr:tyrosine-type recombinase/integrase [Myxococcales bacterium]